jgi:hypothetical protein
VWVKKANAAFDKVNQKRKRWMICKTGEKAGTFETIERQLKEKSGWRESRGEWLG